MTLQEKELVLLACQEQINNLLQFNEYDSRERALLIERLNAEGHSCPHDFGTYYDIALVYNDEIEESEEYMLKVESELPCNWDEESRKKLREAGYPVGEYNEELR